MRTSGRDLLQITNTTRENSGSQLSQGVVSPCSRCANTVDSTGGDYPDCPRRYWAKVAKDLQENLDAPNLPPAYLVRKNRKNNDQAGFENPIPSPDDGTVVVWVALFENNQSRFDPKNPGTSLPGLLDPSFDTRYIRCSHLPYVPGQREGSFLGGNGMSELDVVLVQSAQVFQPDQNNTARLIQVSGYVTKMTAPQRWSNQPANKSTCPQGA